MTDDGFAELMERLAHAWSTQDTELGLSCFTDDAPYTEPPGHERSATADHGVAAVEIDGDRIRTWREYQQKGPASFDEFAAVEGKTWQWHIGNYP